MLAIIDGWMGRRACDLADIYGIEGEVAQTAFKYGLYSLIGVAAITIAIWIYKNATRKVVAL